MLITEVGAGGEAAGQIDIYNFGNANLTSGFITGTGVVGAVFQPTAVIAVPEPASLVLLAGGFAMLMWGRILRRGNRG